MVLLSEKFKFHFGFEDHGKNSDHISSSLRDFRSMITNFLAQMLLKKPKPTSEILSLASFLDYFDLLHVSNKAFAKLVMEIEYPISQWDGRFIEQYLSYTLGLLDLCNAINSAVGSLNQSKVKNLHALKVFDKSPECAAKFLTKIQRISLNLGGVLVEEKCPKEKFNSEKGRILHEALMIMEKTGFLAMGMVLSALCSDSKPYKEMKKFVGGEEDSLIQRMESFHGQEIIKLDGMMAEVAEVNSAGILLSAALSSGDRACGGAAGALKQSLVVLETSVQAVEQQSSKLFYEVLRIRNELLDGFWHNMK